MPTDVWASLVRRGGPGKRPGKVAVTIKFCKSWQNVNSRRRAVGLYLEQTSSGRGHAAARVVRVTTSVSIGVLHVRLPHTSAAKCSRFLRPIRLALDMRFWMESALRPTFHHHPFRSVRLWVRT